MFDDSNDAKVRFFSNRFVIFLFGLLIGVVFSFLLPKIETLSSLSHTNSKIAVDEIAFDPFSQFEIPLNDRISEKIRFYLHPGRKVDLLQSYKRSGKYIPMIKAIFEEYNLPQVFAFLPILESRFLPNSRSRAGAVGLWQIMPATASDHGLKYDRWIDERRDPEKATVVAAEYLQFLYDRFRNWDLVLAAYNGGHSKLRKLLRRENTSNFWQLKGLPKETYNFVPKFYALLHILAKPEIYGIKLPQMDDAVDFETLDIEATFSIEQIARLANVSEKVIKAYNPALIGEIAPSGKYSIRVPIGVKEHFLQQYQENPPEQVEITYTSYRVKKGDSLHKIAKRFGTTVSAIKADNNLRSSRWIKAGTKLRIVTVSVKPLTTPEMEENTKDHPGESESNKIKFVYHVERDELSLNTLGRYYAVSIDELKKWNPWLPSDTLQKGEELSIYKTRDSISFHKTRKGDSLWKLARRHNTTVSNLRRWNQITGSRIYPGANLIVELRGNKGKNNQGATINVTP